MTDTLKVLCTLTLSSSVITLIREIYSLSYASRILTERNSCHANVHKACIGFHVSYTKKLTIFSSTKLLKIISISVLRVSYEFLKGSITIFMFTTFAIVNTSKQGSSKLFQCFRY